MLVLTRKIDQGIVISGNIYVRVLGVERDRVKIGISAPLDVTILRQELLEREGGNGGANKQDTAHPSTNAANPAPSTIVTSEEPSKED